LATCGLSCVFLYSTLNPHLIPKLIIVEEVVVRENAVDFVGDVVNGLGMVIAVIASGFVGAAAVFA